MELPFLFKVTTGIPGFTVSLLWSVPADNFIATTTASFYTPLQSHFIKKHD